MTCNTKYMLKKIPNNLYKTGLYSKQNFTHKGMALRFSCF